MNIFEQLKKRGFLIIFSAIVFYLLLTFFSDVNQINQSFKKIEIWYLPLILIAVTLSIFCKSIRQKILLKNVLPSFSIKDSFLIFTAGLSLLMTPGATGTFVKSYFLKNKFRLPLSKSIPIIIIERYFDLFGILVIISIFLIFYYFETLVIPIIILDALLVTIYFILRSKNLQKHASNILRKISKNNKYSEFIDESGEEIKNLISGKKLLVIGPFSILCWSFDVIAFYLCFLSFGFSLDVFESGLISLFSLVFGFITLIPGGLGVTELSMMGLLVRPEIEFSDASALVLFLRLCTVWFATFLGIVATRYVLKNTNLSNNKIN